MLQVYLVLLYQILMQLRYQLPTLKVVVEMTALAVVMILVMIMKMKILALKIAVVAVLMTA